MRIEYPFAQETASEVIIKLCEFAGHKDGMVKIWIWDGTPSQFYALFNKTVATKPVIGTAEWTFQKDELVKLNTIAMKYTDSIEVKLASKSSKDGELVIYYEQDENGDDIIKQAKLIAFNSKLLSLLGIFINISISRSVWRTLRRWDPS